jgi:hypothetical protein
MHVAGFIEQQRIKINHYAALEGPSCSWIAHSTKVSFLKVTDIKSEVLECTVEPRDKALPFGNILSGRLVIKSKACNLKYYSWSPEFYFDDGRSDPSDLKET